MDVNHQQQRTSKVMLTSALLNAGAKIKGAAVFCPFHEDANASGSIYDTNGVWRFKCHGCGFCGDLYDVQAKTEGRPLAEILSENHGDVRPAKRRPAPKPRIYQDLDKLAQGLPGGVAGRYDYTHPETGKVELIIFRCVENGKKTFRQLHLVKGGFVMQAPSKPWPLYNRKRVAGAESVVVVEGEKCVHRLHDIGIVATTSPCGAGKAQYADWSPLAGKSITLWPDNDDNGKKHMDDVEQQLLSLQPNPQLGRVNIDALELPPKGDVEQFLDRLGDMNLDSQRQALWCVLESSKPKKPSLRVMERLADTIDGKRRAIDWPWPTLSRMTKALLPGTITLVAGPPASAKSLFVLESLHYWYQKGIKAVVLELEEDLEFHLNRALSQLLEKSDILDDQWVRDNPEWTLDHYCQSAEFLDGFGRCIHERPAHMMTLTEVKEWIASVAGQGNRVIVVDPITIADKVTSQPWNEDKRFMSDIQKIVADHQVSIVLVTHPKKGRNGLIDLEQVAGGASYSLFSQTVLWVENHHPPQTLRVETPCGTMDNVSVNRTVMILKVRNARGTGHHIGFNLDGKTLRFAEQGIIDRTK